MRRLAVLWRGEERLRITFWYWLVLAICCTAQC